MCITSRTWVRKSSITASSTRYDGRNKEELTFHMKSMQVLQLWSACVSPGLHFTPGSRRELLLRKRLLAAAPLLVWMQSGSLELPLLPSHSSLASSPHLRVESPGSSRPQTASAARLCLHLHLSACRPAADPQIIITIKHCFPNKTISLPLIRCQSLFLFTSGHLTQRPL